MGIYGGNAEYFFINPNLIYLFKVSNGNNKTYEISSKLTIKTPEWRHLRRSGVFIVNFGQISHIVLVFPLSVDR